MMTTKLILEYKRSHVRAPILPVMKKRFSPRFFSNEPIPKRDIDAMVEAARWTPSGHNSQPWYFYWVRRGDKTYNAIPSCLPDFNQWSLTAPIFVVACYEAKDKGRENPFALYDLGASVISLIYQAQELGYYTRQMGIFDVEKLVKRLSIPKVRTPFVILAIGKLGDYTKIDKALLERELTPRERKEDIAKQV